MVLHPTTRKRLNRFTSIKRGYYSFLIIVGLVLMTFVLEILVNSRALVVSYQGDLYFPTYASSKAGTIFGLDFPYETNYRELSEKWKSESSSNWMLLPPIPYNPFENDFSLDENPPNAPSWTSKHYLGTDGTGRDILARLLYGFRVAFYFSFALYIVLPQ